MTPPAFDTAGFSPKNLRRALRVVTRQIRDLRLTKKYLKSEIKMIENETNRGVK